MTSITHGLINWNWWLQKYKLDLLVVFPCRIWAATFRYCHPHQPNCIRTILNCIDLFLNYIELYCISVILTERSLNSMHYTVCHYLFFSLQATTNWNTCMVKAPDIWLLFWVKYRLYNSLTLGRTRGGGWMPSPFLRFSVLLACAVFSSCSFILETHFGKVCYGNEIWRHK